MNILFLIQPKKKLGNVIHQLENTPETFSNSLYICFKCGKNNIYSSGKQVSPADEGTTVFNKCSDCHKNEGWMTALRGSIGSLKKKIASYMAQYLKFWGMFISYTCMF